MRDQMPEHFHVGGVEGEVGLRLINPVADARGKGRPQADVAQHTLAALRVEGRDAIALNVLLTGEVQLLLHFKLDREPVCVPAGAALYAVAAHRLVARYRVFEGPALEMGEAGLAVCGRWPLIEHEIAVRRRLLE